MTWWRTSIGFVKNFRHLVENFGIFCLVWFNKRSKVQAEHRSHQNIKREKSPPKEIIHTRGPYNLFGRTIEILCIECATNK